MDENYKKIKDQLSENKVFGFVKNNILIPDEPEPAAGRRALDFDSLPTNDELDRLNKYPDLKNSVKIGGTITEVGGSSTENNLVPVEKGKKYSFKSVAGQNKMSAMVNGFAENTAFHNQWALTQYGVTFNQAGASAIAMFVLSPFFARVFFNQIDGKIYFLNDAKQLDDWHTWHFLNLRAYDAESKGLWTALSNYFSSRWDSTLSANTIAQSLIPWISTTIVKNPIDEVLKLYKFPAGITPEKCVSDFLKGFGQTDAPYADKALKHFLKAIVKRNLASIPVKYDDVLILKGQQGLGKSEFSRNLSLGYFTENISLKSGDEYKDSIIRRSQVVIAELAELSALRKADVESAKQQISLTTARVRLPYGHSDVDLPMRAILIGTSNSMDMLNDPTGNRRFWPIGIEKLPDTSDPETVVRLLKWASLDLQKDPVYYFTRAEADEYSDWKIENYSTSDPDNLVFSDYLLYTLNTTFETSLTRLPDYKGASAARKQDWTADFQKWFANARQNNKVPYLGKFWETMTRLGLKRTTLPSGDHAYVLKTEDVLSHWALVLGTSPDQDLINSFQTGVRKTSFFEEAPDPETQLIKKPKPSKKHDPKTYD